MAVIQGEFDVVLTIRFATQPGTLPDKAGMSIAANGVTVPLGLVQYVKNIDVSVVPSLEVGPKLV